MKKQKNEECVLLIHFHGSEGHYHLHTNESKTTTADWIGEAINEGERFVWLEDADGDPFFLNLEQVDAIGVTNRENDKCSHDEEN